MPAVVAGLPSALLQCALMGSLMPVDPGGVFWPIALNLAANGGVMSVESTRYFPQAEFE